MDPDPDPGGPKTYGSGFGSGSATLKKEMGFEAMNQPSRRPLNLKTLLGHVEEDA
jgi:hypothetical protein